MKEQIPLILGLAMNIIGTFFMAWGLLFAIPRERDLESILLLHKFYQSSEEPNMIGVYSNKTEWRDDDTLTGMTMPEQNPKLYFEDIVLDQQLELFKIKDITHSNAIIGFVFLGFGFILQLLYILANNA